MAVVPVDQVPADVRLARITARARAIRPGRTFLTMLAAVLYGLGWLIAKTFGVLWLALTWCAAAVQVGWEDARAVPSPGAPQPDEDD